MAQGGYGGTWPARIWHTFAENMFVPLGVQKFQPAGVHRADWNQVPPGLRVGGPAACEEEARPGPESRPRRRARTPAHGARGRRTRTPTRTYSCDPTVVTCDPNAPATGGRHLVAQRG